MRVTTIQMQSPTLEEPIDFSLSASDPRARYKVREIAGLDAEEIVSKFYGWGLNSNQDTPSGFYNLIMKERDIVMRIVLNPKVSISESFSDIRDELYRSISATRNGRVTLYFKSGATTVSCIRGSISKFEASYFTQTPEVQITIKCDDPMFRGVNPVIYSDADLATSNPVIIPDSLSTSPHGFSMELEFTATSPTLTIQDEATDPNWTFVVTPSGGFLVGDILHFSSEYGNQYLYLVRGASTIELADKVSPSSIWPIIFPGSNTFYFLEIVKFDWTSVSFYASYWGV